MIPWIQVYSNLPQHPKTTKLADELGLASAALNPNVLAVGLVVGLSRTPTMAILRLFPASHSGGLPAGGTGGEPPGKDPRPREALQR